MDSVYMKYRVVQNNFGVTQFEEINKHADQIEAIWSILNVETQTQVSRFPFLTIFTFFRQKCFETTFFSKHFNRNGLYLK